MAASCPAVRRHSPLKGERTVSMTGTQLPSGGRCEFQASLLVKRTVYQVGALIDSGAEGDLMDSGLARRLGLPSVVQGSRFFIIHHIHNHTGYNQ